MDNIEIQNKIIQAVEFHKNTEGWADMALIGKQLSISGVNYKALGYLKLRELLEEFPGNIELKKDETSHILPVYYVKVISSDFKPENIIPSKETKTASRTKQIPHKLLDWASMDFRKHINDLKNMAIKERWYYRTQNPTDPFPILSKHLLYTFYRLSKERGKIKMSNQFASFNTGLVNNLYEPIYALFGKNKNEGRQEWYFYEFCTSGVDKAGKILASNFNPLPKRAQFFNNPAELIYDIDATEPQMDWKHIILDNVSRLPIEFLEENKPQGFLLRETSTMNTIENIEYYQSLANAIESDSKQFRTIKNRFVDSLSLAIKRVQWNFKTAIPMYYPKKNNISLLLPLSLLDDNVIDVALVTEKTQSGSYLGHTILPLAMAYSNARLISRPDSDWLIAENIEPNNNEDNEEVDKE